MKSSALFLLLILLSLLSLSQQPIINVVPGAVTVMPASDAALTNGLKNTSYQNLDKDPKVFAIQDWKSKDQSFMWNANVTKKEDYQVAILLQIRGLSANSSVTIQLSTPTGKILLQSMNMEWEKIIFPGSLIMEAGINQLQLQLTQIPEGEHPDINLYSIELATKNGWEKYATAAESLRSNPEWLNKAKYGLFFHWNARSKPRTGPAKSYSDAVKDFDVTKFSLMVHKTGAQFIVLTTSWDLSTFPAPLKSLDNLLPGNTTPRDLIADLAGALSKWDIKLLVYCNFRINRFGWKKEHELTPGKNDSSFNKLLSIYSEIGMRYAKKIGGLWIDDGMGLYPYNAPFETLARVIKRGNKNMVLGYNSWIYPRFTDFQDFYGGEHGITLKAAGVNNKYLPVGGNGYFISGPQKGLKATFCGLLEPGDWTHTEPESLIPSPLLKAPDLIKIIREAILRKNVAIMNVQVYQNGTISPETFELLKQLNQSVNK